MLAQDDEARALDRQVNCPAEKETPHVVHGFTAGRGSTTLIKYWVLVKCYFEYIVGLSRFCIHLLCLCCQSQLGQSVAAVWAILTTTCLNEPEIEAAFDFFRNSVC